MVTLVFLGAPGAGKGTQAQILKERYNFLHISTGDILRAEKEKNTELSKRIREIMEKGELVPDEIVVQVLKENIKDLDAKNGIIFDGFPRTVRQAEMLEEMLKEKNLILDKVFFFEVSKDKVIERLSKRLICKNCGKIYHLKNMPPKVDGICDDCGGELIQREDDKEEVVENRWKNYLEQTQPLIDFYSKKGILVRINADLEKEETFREIREILNLK